MDFGQRLKNLRLERGYTQQDLSSAVGVSTVAVRSWEHNTKKPNMDALIALGRFLNTSIDTLLDIQPKGSEQNYTFILSPAEKRFLQNYRELDSHGKKIVNTVCSLEKERIDLAAKPKNRSKVIQLANTERERYIPRYTTPSAAGTSVPLDGADFEMILVDNSVPDEADYAVNIQGNSMFPYIHDGDMVYVKKDAEMAIGDVGIFCVDGAMYCKQYYVDENGNLELVSANPELRNTNVFVSSDSGSSVKCYGKVLMGFKLELPDYLFEEAKEQGNHALLFLYWIAD